MKTICPIVASTLTEALEQLEILNASACDRIEFRLDGLKKEPEAEMKEEKETVKEERNEAQETEKEEREEDYVKRLLEAAKAVEEKSDKPVIFTFRTQHEGGLSSLEPKGYESLVHGLMEREGLVDVELARLSRFATQPNFSKVVLSFHDFEKTPSRQALAYLFAEMDDFKPAVSKIAAMAHSKEDVANMLCANYESKKDIERIAISMGGIGKISRIIGDLFGSDYTFCALTTSSAPGQVGLEELDDYRSVLDEK